MAENRIRLPLTGIMLELGCGNERHNRAKEYPVGMDAVDFGQAIVWDLETGIPLPDGSCKGIYASHIFEHLHQDKIIFILNECWRVLQSHGQLWVVVPPISHESAYIPAHLTRFNEDSFRFFTGDLNAQDYPEDKLHEGINVSKIHLWDIAELVTNDKNHIHCKMTPRK